MFPSALINRGAMPPIKLITMPSTTVAFAKLVKPIFYRETHSDHQCSAHGAQPTVKRRRWGTDPSRAPNLLPMRRAA
jgi:hypothetical protein